MELLKQSTKLICRAILFTLIFAVIILTGTRIISLTVAGRIICSTLRITQTIPLKNRDFRLLITTLRQAGLRNIRSSVPYRNWMTTNRYFITRGLIWTSFCPFPCGIKTYWTTSKTRPERRLSSAITGLVM